jgi:hypothetical protein
MAKQLMCLDEFPCCYPVPPSRLPQKMLILGRSLRFVVLEQIFPCFFPCYFQKQENRKVGTDEPSGEGSTQAEIFIYHH